MQITAIHELLASKEDVANGLPANARTSQQPSKTNRTGPSSDLLTAENVAAALALDTKFYPQPVIDDLLALAREFNGFTGICAKSGREFWQVSYKEVMAMLLAGNSKQVVAYWLSSELTKRIAPEWITTSSAQLDNLADTDPVGYLLYQMGLGCRPNAAYTYQRVMAQFYNRINKQADHTKLLTVNENLRRLLSWVSHKNVKDRGHVNLVQILNDWLTTMHAWKADQFLDFLEKQIKLALERIIKHCQKLNIIGKEFIEADIYNLRERMQGYTNLHLQRKKDHSQNTKQALVELLDMTGFDPNRADLRARGIQSGFMPTGYDAAPLPVQPVQPTETLTKAATQEVKDQKFTFGGSTGKKFTIKRKATS